jgi:hypothetical protein
MDEWFVVQPAGIYGISSRSMDLPGELLRWKIKEFK